MYRKLVTPRQRGHAIRLLGERTMRGALPALIRRSKFFSSPGPLPIYGAFPPCPRRPLGLVRVRVAGQATLQSVWRQVGRGDDGSAPQLEMFVAFHVRSGNPVGRIDAGHARRTTVPSVAHRTSVQGQERIRHGGESQDRRDQSTVGRDRGPRRNAEQPLELETRRGGRGPSRRILVAQDRADARVTGERNWLGWRR